VIATYSSSPNPGALSSSWFCLVIVFGAAELHCLKSGGKCESGKCHHKMLGMLMKIIFRIEQSPNANIVPYHHTTPIPKPRCTSTFTFPQIPEVPYMASNEHHLVAYQKEKKELNTRPQNHAELPTKNHNENENL
jgi:hypothetical protein